MKNPDQPDIVGKPLQFNAPVQVAMNEQLYLYARLEVLDAGIVWAPGSDPTAGVSGALNGLGGAFNQLGQLLPDTPVGAAGQAIGTFLQIVGQFTSPPQHGPQAACIITNTLVPGFGQNNPPSDTGSSLLRAPIDGRTLYELTARGDAGLAYDLDWRPFPQTTMCQKVRPRTKVIFRIRRVQMTGDPGAPTIAQGSLIDGTYPDRFDSYATDCNGAVIHDQRGADVNYPLAWTAGDSVPSGGPAPNARITALSRAPGLTDLFAVSPSGDIVSNWRSKWVNNNQWHSWFAVTSGGKFPAGAPVAVVSRNPDHIDVFAIAKDESIVTAWFDSCCSWQPEFAVSPANQVPAWDGSSGGGLAAVARSNGNVDVYVADRDWTIANAYWVAGSNWAFATGDSPLWVRPGSEITAISRNSHHTDVFYVDAYRKLQALAWDNGWGAPQQVVPDKYALQYGAPVAVVSRKVNATGDPIIDNDHLDVFTVESTGHVLHGTWRYGDDNYTWNPVRAQELAQTAPAFAPIGAAALEAGAIQVAAKNLDSTMAHTWYEDVEDIVSNWQNGQVYDSNGTEPCGNICCGNYQTCVSGACCNAGKACGSLCCPGYQFCGGGGVAGACGCTPAKCDVGSCGSFPDGCGGTTTCGGCATFQVCYYNQCTSKFCVPKKCAKGSYWNSDDCHCEVGLPF